MNWRGRPELQERLAAEYALGTLRGAARARFQAWLAEDAALAARVAGWEARLGPLLEGVEPRRPPARLWRRVEARLGAAPARRGLWEHLAFWRGLGLAASGAAAALLASVALLAPPPPASAPPPLVVRVPSNEIPDSYLAVLTDPKSGKPVLVVSAGRKERQLWTKTIDPAIHAAEGSLELWGLPEGGGTPRSLGVVSPDEKVMLALPAAADVSLAGMPMLAISLEPRGGSPTGRPTGPVLYTGPCVQYW